MPGPELARPASVPSGTRPVCLFICYSGLYPHYLESLFGPQLIALAAGGVRVTVLSFEEPTLPRDTRERIERAFAGARIAWHVMRYHRRPLLLAKAWDVAAGALWILLWSAARRGAVLHARSHLPAAMALPGTWLGRARLVFDIDGALPDEYVDAGRWRRDDFMYRGVKLLERLLLHSADVTVTHTRPQAERLAGSARRVLLVRHGIDLKRFAVDRAQGERHLARLGLGGRIVFAYVGSADARVYRLADMARFVTAAARAEPRAHLLFVASAGSREEEIRRALRAGDLEDERVTVIVGLPPADVPPVLAAAHAGLAFRDVPTGGYAISPVKVAEYLASGIPVVSHEGIGDLAEILRTTRTGVVLDERLVDLARGVEELITLREDPRLPERCRVAAASYFSLEQTVRGLLDAYAVGPQGAGP